MNPADDKRNSVEKSKKEQRYSAGLVKDSDDRSNSSSYKAMEQQLNKLIPITDNEDPDRLSSDSYTGANPAAQRSANFSKIKVRQREEMNALILEEESREKNRVRSLEKLSNEDDRRKLRQEHQRER